mgnify:CR=1 FL=1
MAKAGDTIYIDAGLYADTYVNVSATETAGFKIDTDNISIIGKDSNATVIDPPGDSSTSGLFGVYADTQSGLSIRNLGIRNAYHVIYFVNVDSAVIQGDSISHNGANGVYLMPSFGRYENCLEVLEGTP